MLCCLGLCLGLAGLVLAWRGLAWPGLVYSGLDLCLLYRLSQTVMSEADDQIDELRSKMRMLREFFLAIFQMVILHFRRLCLIILSFPRTFFVFNRGRPKG